MHKLSSFTENNSLLTIMTNYSTDDHGNKHDIAKLLLQSKTSKLTESVNERSHLKKNNERMNECIH